MALLTAQIVAPDSAHWATWLDGALSADKARRDAARGFHQRLLDQGKVAFLSWHHVEELLGIEDDANARDRIAFLQSLPLIAWMLFPGEQAGLGAVTDILAAEAIAADGGCDTPAAVRDQVRRRLMRTGPAIDAIGSENWVWEVVRPEILARRPHADMVAALSGVRTFNDSQTVAAVAAQERSSPEKRKLMMAAIHERMFREAMAADSARTAPEAYAMADAFVASVVAMMPAENASVRDHIVATYVAQGLDAEEVLDECRLSDLSSSRPSGAICGWWRKRPVCRSSG